MVVFELRVEVTDEGPEYKRVRWFAGTECIHDEQFTLDEHGEIPLILISSAWSLVREDLIARGWPGL